MKPKIFVSYSWSSAQHRLLVKEWADRLIADGIDVVIDIYGLKEGQDKYAFMEKMVTDTSVSHVLLVCDRKYAEKADERKAGVGTETQIISKEVYDKVEQTKFIPIVCEFDESAQPFLPTFFGSRIFIDFSTPEKVNENWEQLVRSIYGKPLYEKPKLGKPPVYITSETAAPTSSSHAKFSTLKQAILQGKPSVPMHRRDFLDACIEYADELRVRERPDVESLGEKILEDTKKLKLIRDLIIDWVVLESESNPDNGFSDVLIDFLERLRKLKSRPPELNQWSVVWFEAHSLFVYETFLYVVAALLKTRSFAVLHEILSINYLRPEVEMYGDKVFDSFNVFYCHSEALKAMYAQKGTSYYSAAAEVIKRHADREDITFSSIMEADLLILLMAFIDPTGWWYPQTLYYAGYRNKFLIFLRATQHKYFSKLAIVTGINDADKLRDAVSEGQKRLKVGEWYNFHFDGAFWGLMNMEKLDTLK